MTPITLLDRLKEFIEEQTRDLLLPARVKSDAEVIERPADVYKMRLPTPEGETKLIPYILLQFVKGEDTQEEGQDQENEAMVRIVIATYSADGQTGAMNVLNIITRLRTEMLKTIVIGEQFSLKKPLEYIVYPDSTHPYYLGEMITRWDLPTIKREVKNLWY
jgi:hypothetical protein